MKSIKIGLIILLILILITILILGGYVLYLSINYYRIDDNTSLDILGNADEGIVSEKEYTVLSYNIGFGAYDREYSFFMDTGTMKDGTEVKGKNAKAVDEEATMANTEGVIMVTEGIDADFNLYQEVDRDSSRSYHINQEDMIVANLAHGERSLNCTYGSNFHSVFLAYPFNDPIGSIESGLVTTSRYKISDAVRRSFPVTESFIDKFFDLDRCFVVNRIEVDGKNVSENPHLVLINVHMSAYDKGGVIRKQQMEMLADVFDEETAKGNWVIVGGDLNHALYGTESTFDSDQEIPDWVQPFDEDTLPSNMMVVKADNIYDVATVRGSDLPYEEGVNYLAVIDGFVISDNITATSENIDAGFEYSDHNPTLLKFKLN